MSTDLDAAVARLKRDLDAIAAETSGAKEARGDVRLLLADWERLREMTSPAAGLARLEQELGIMDKTIAERDAARAEVERLKAELTSEREQWAGFVDACAQVGVTWTMRDPTPEHPIGVEIRNAAVTELARLRERDARVLERLGAVVHSPECECGLSDVVALLKETP